MKNTFNINGQVDITVYDEHDNVINKLYGANNITDNYKRVILNSMLSTGQVIKPENIAFFSTPGASNSLTGVNSQGTSASLSGTISLTTSYNTEGYGVKFSIAHKNPASGSDLNIASINLGRGWNSTYNQWNTIIAHVQIDNLNFEKTLDTNILTLHPKERFNIDWVITLS